MHMLEKADNQVFEREARANRLTNATLLRHEAFDTWTLEEVAEGFG